jgi:hypothetical protein
MEKKSSDIEIVSKYAELSGGLEQSSNPLRAAANNTAKDLSSYNQTLNRSGYDEDIIKIVEIVRVLNNMAPIRMPEYNFNIDEINGERFYKPDGELLLIRDFDLNVIRDYYFKPDYTDIKYSVSRILEHDRNTGRLKVKIEPITRAGSRLKTNVVIFDEKVNNKYYIIQLSEGGIVNNISEFSGIGKSFQTLFRNINNFKPVRYLEGKDNKENGFEMVDCLFSETAEIVRIKRYNKKKEVSINYTDSKKNITVKNISK